MTASTPESTIRLSDVVARISRRRTVVVVTTLLTLTAATLLGLVWPASYSSTAVVTVNPITTTPFSSTPVNQQINITTERAIVMSSEVAALAADSYGSPLDPQDVPAAIRIDSPLNSQVLEITATHSEPRGAAATANGVAQAYLAFRAQGAEEVALRLVTNLDQRIAELVEQLSDDPEDAALPTQVAIQQQISSLRQQQSELSVIAINPGRIITTAQPSSEPSGLGLVLFVVPGLVLGLIAGLLLALLRDATDRRVRDGGRLDTLVDVPTVQEGPEGDLREVGRRAVLRLGLTAPHARQPVLVGVLAPDAETCRIAAGALCEAVTRAGRRSALVPSEQVTTEQAETGWPDTAQLRRWRSLDVVVVGLQSAESRAHSAMLAQRMDLVVLAAAPSTSQQEVLALIDDVADAGVSPSLVVLVPTGRRQQRFGWRRHRAPAAASTGRAADGAAAEGPPATTAQPTGSPAAAAQATPAKTIPAKKATPAKTTAAQAPADQSTPAGDNGGPAATVGRAPVGPRPSEGRTDGAPEVSSRPTEGPHGTTRSPQKGAPSAGTELASARGTEAAADARPTAAVPLRDGDRRGRVPNEQVPQRPATEPARGR